MLLPRRLRKNRVMIHAVMWRTGMRGRGRAGARARTCYIHSNICAHMYMYICTDCACLGSVIDARASTLASECEGKSKRVGRACQQTHSISPYPLQARSPGPPEAQSPCPTSTLVRRLLHVFHCQPRAARTLFQRPRPRRNATPWVPTWGS